MIDSPRAQSPCGHSLPFPHPSPIMGGGETMGGKRGGGRKMAAARTTALTAAARRGGDGGGGNGPRRRATSPARLPALFLVAALSLRECSGLRFGAGREMERGRREGAILPLFFLLFPSQSAESGVVGGGRGKSACGNLGCSACVYWDRREKRPRREMLLRIMEEVCVWNSRRAKFEVFSSSLAQPLPV